jgi:hypothetical protein
VKAMQDVIKGVSGTVMVARVRVFRSMVRKVGAVICMTVR